MGEEEKGSVGKNQRDGKVEGWEVIKKSMLQRDTCLYRNTKYTWIVKRTNIKFKGRKQLISEGL